MADGPCDMCELDPGERHPDIALRFCESCRAMFEEYRHATTLGYPPSYMHHRSGVPGPKPKLTPYRLGVLSSLFRSERGRRKLERLADELCRA